MLSHERLDAYQRALPLHVLARHIARAFPRGSGDLADQLSRASRSVVLNIAEGAGRVSASTSTSTSTPDGDGDGRRATATTTTTQASTATLNGSGSVEPTSSTMGPTPRLLQSWTRSGSSGAHIDGPWPGQCFGRTITKNH